ncbi:hypothetical protein JY97_08475 [Alkalispirochaeta odontotermitis]|nr:hypothetical protein JY97_08475 [Alkalispirochaeta odontotermitis]
MAKFVFLYSGPPGDMSTMSEEDTKAEMEAWDKWINANKEVFVDSGAPFGESEAIVDDGSSKKPLDIQGYSIIEADDMNAAKSLSRNCPMLREKTGKYAVEIFQVFPMPS